MQTAGPCPPDQELSRSSPAGRGALAAVTIGSGVALLDGTIVNIALPAIGRDLGASFSQLQWVVNGYMLTLASLVLTGGALGDRLGRRRMYLIGVMWFGIASVLCAVATNPTMLVAARVVQGVGGALLTPGALAIIQSSFRREDRASAIGTWAGLSGIATAAGPFVGGWILENVGWRWIFGINVPLIALVVALTLKFVPESSTPNSARFDVWGSVLAVLGLGATTYFLTELGNGLSGIQVGVGVLGFAALAAFLWVEAHSKHPQMPLWLFGSRVFSAANAMTFLVYGALSVVMFLMVIQLQVSSGFSALASGLAGLPVTVVMMLFSSRAASLGERLGPRIPMTVGPLICAAGAVGLATITTGTRYWTGVFPAILVFAVGLTLLVSPLTASVLAAAPDRVAGVASGINNAVARSGSLLAVAALPALAGITGSDYTDPAAFTDGYRTALLISAALLAAGGVVSWFGLSSGPLTATTTEPAAQA